MNLFNRIVMFLLCLALAAAAIAAIVLAWTIPNESINALRAAVDWLARHNQDTEKALLTTGGALVALLALIVLLLELLPQSTSEVKITDLKVGDALLSTAAIGQRIEEAVGQVPHVGEVKATVKAKRKGVVVSLDLHVDPDANLAEVTDQALDTTREVLTNRVHVSLAAPPKARLHYRELRMRGNQARRPASVITPPPPPSPPQLPPPSPEAERAAEHAEVPTPPSPWERAPEERHAE